MHWIPIPLGIFRNDIIEGVFMTLYLYQINILSVRSECFFSIKSSVHFIPLCYHPLQAIIDSKALCSIIVNQDNFSETWPDLSTASKNVTYIHIILFFFSLIKKKSWRSRNVSYFCKITKNKQRKWKRKWKKKRNLLLYIIE